MKRTKKKLDSKVVAANFVEMLELSTNYFCLTYQQAWSVVNNKLVSHFSRPVTFVSRHIDAWHGDPGQGQRLRPGPCGSPAEAAAWRVPEHCLHQS